MRGRGHGAITHLLARRAAALVHRERSYQVLGLVQLYARRERERRVQWCSPRGGPGTCASPLFAGPRRGRRRGTLRSSSRPRSCASTSDASISSWPGAPPGAGGAGPPQCSADESSRRGPWASELPDDLWRRPGGDGPPWLRARPPRCSAPWSGAGGGLPAPRRLRSPGLREQLEALGVARRLGLERHPGGACGGAAPCGGACALLHPTEGRGAVSVCPRHAVALSRLLKPLLQTNRTERVSMQSECRPSRCGDTPAAPARCDCHQAIMGKYGRERSSSARAVGIAQRRWHRVGPAAHADALPADSVHGRNARSQLRVNRGAHRSLFCAWHVPARHRGPTRRAARTGGTPAGVRRTAGHLHAALKVLEINRCHRGPFRPGALRRRANRDRGADC